MDILQILLISVGLAADAFAVSVVKGLSVKNISVKDTIKLALCFGTFQGIMPLIGYLLGSAFEKIIVNVDHYVAFVLLGFIGIKMIIESNTEEENNNSDLSIKNILLLGVATSIDALAVGIAYACAYGSNNAILTFTVIAIITFILSMIGVKIGSKFGSKYDKVAQIIGGIILILLGTNILLEHLKIL